MNRANSTIVVRYFFKANVCLAFALLPTEGDAHGTISTCVLVASYDDDKSTVMK